jgi:hypothetical protein
VKAIHRGALRHVTDDDGAGVLLDDGIYVRFGDPDLIIDPTDDQVDVALAGLTIPPDAEDESDLGRL